MNAFGLQQPVAEVPVEVERRELISLQIPKISHLVSYQFYIFQVFDEIVAILFISLHQIYGEVSTAL